MLRFMIIVLFWTTMALLIVDQLEKTLGIWAYLLGCVPIIVGFIYIPANAYLFDPKMPSLPIWQGLVLGCLASTIFATSFILIAILTKKLIF